MSDGNEENKQDVEKTSFESSKDEMESQKINKESPNCEEETLENERASFQSHKEYSDFRRYMAIPEPAAFWNLSMCRATNR